MQDCRNLSDQRAGLENAGLENDGLEVDGLNGSETEKNSKMYDSM